MNRRFSLVSFGLAAGLLVPSCAPQQAAPTPPQVVVSVDAPAVALPEAPRDASGLLLARFGETRLRHPHPVRSLALTRDGRLLATTTTGERVVRVWDVATGRLVRALQLDPPKTLSVSLVGFAPDGRRLVAVSHEAAGPGDHAKGWVEPVTIDITTGAVARWHWGAESVYDFPALTVSPDGKTVAGVCKYGELKVWDLDTGRELRTLGKLPSPSQFFNGVCFSPDGTRVAAWTDTRDVSVALVDGGRPLVTFALSRDWNGVPFAVWPHPDRLVCARHPGFVVLNPETGAEVERRADIFDRQPAVGGGLMFVKDGLHGGKITAIDLATLKPVPDRTFPHNGRDQPTAASGDGKVLALVAGHAVWLYDVATARPLHPDLDRFPADPAARFDLSSDGTRLLAVGGRSATTWDLPAGKLLAALTDHPPVHGLSPNGKQVAAAGAPGGGYGVLNADTGALLCRWPEGDGAKGLGYTPHGFSAAGRPLVVEGASGDWLELDPATGTLSNRVPGYPGTFYLASPDGSKLVSSGWVGLAVRDATQPNAGWVELESYRDKQTARCGLSPPTCALPVRFSPDGRRLLTRGIEGGHDLWDLTGRPVRVGRLDGIHGGGEWWSPDAAFSPDGRRLAAVCVQYAEINSDGTHRPAPRPFVRVWETASARELMRFDPPAGVHGCAFSPDGTRLVVGHADTTIGVWDYRALEAAAVVGKLTADLRDALAAPDPAVGLAAVRVLAAGAGSVTTLRDLFRPADPATLAKLVAALGDDEFAMREDAGRRLAELGWRAEAALREAAIKSASPEVRDRAGRLVRAFEGTASRPTAARMQAVRAVEVLERIGSKDAAEVLAVWAKDHPGTVLGAEAKAAANRLAARR